MKIVADPAPPGAPPGDGAGPAPAAVVAREPRWDDVLLVCKACGKRGGGPRKLSPKALASLLKKEGKASGRRTRVVMSDCLGLCPKAATTVARLGHDVVTRLVAVKSKKQVDAALAALRGPDGA